MSDKDVVLAPNHWDLLRDGDMDLISAPIDFFGVNYYNPVRSGVIEKDTGAGVLERTHEVLEVQPDVMSTDMGREVYSQGLADLVAWLQQDYSGIHAIIITENGAAFPDHLEAGEEVTDVLRIQYLQGHIQVIANRIKQGRCAPINGYFA